LWELRKKENKNLHNWGVGQNCLDNVNCSNC